MMPISEDIPKAFLTFPSFAFDFPTTTRSVADDLTALIAEQLELINTALRIIGAQRLLRMRQCRTSGT